MSQKTGVNAIINSTANNWNQNDELRAFESLTTQISTANRNKKIIIAVQNRKELCKIVLKIHSDEVKGFQITSVISPLHSIIFIAACANSPVSIILQKYIKCFSTLKMRLRFLFINASDNVIFRLNIFDKV